MSGVINSAGSKSGEIGTTELDYEAGTWTPSGSNVNSSDASYMRIGAMVFLLGFVNIEGGTCSQVTGLPFSMRDGTGNHQGDGVASHVSGTSATVQLHGSKGNTVLNLYQGASGFSIAAGNNMYFGFSYFTDNV